MASKPYPDIRRGVWKMKFRPDPQGEWKSVTLGHDERLLTARPPKEPPKNIKDRAAEFEEIEYRAKYGLQAAPARAKDLGAYIQQAIDAHAQIRKSGSTEQLRRHAAQFLAFAKGRGVDSVQGVGKGLCRDYLESRAGKVAPNTLRKERGYLIGIWTRAVEDDLVAVNPWTGAKVKAKVVVSEPTFWDAAEIGRIIAACRVPWHKDFVALLANTGLRVSTGLAMAWSWVEWGDGRIVIPEGDEIKTQYSHRMSDSARDILQRRRFAKGGNSLVFPSPKTDNRVTYNSAREFIVKAIERAGVRPGTPHDLRHSYARHLILRGATIPEVQSQLGHASLAMTSRYAVMTAAQASAMTVMDLGFGVKAEGGQET